MCLRGGALHYDGFFTDFRKGVGAILLRMRTERHLKSNPEHAA